MTDLVPDRAGALDALPTFALSFGVDDDDAPTQVTVYADDIDEIATHWITIDAAHAVPLDTVP